MPSLERILDFLLFGPRRPTHEEITQQCVPVGYIIHTLNTLRMHSSVTYYGVKTTALKKVVDKLSSSLLHLHTIDIRLNKDSDFLRILTGNPRRNRNAHLPTLDDLLNGGELSEVHAVRIRRVHFWEG